MCSPLLLKEHWGILFWLGLILFRLKTNFTVTQVSQVEQRFAQVVDGCLLAKQENADCGEVTVIL